MNASNARRRASFAALACGLLVAGSLMVGLPAAAAEPPRPLIEIVGVHNLTTDDVQGRAIRGDGAITGDGDLLVLTAGRQTFGVAYGSSAHPETSVTFFSIVLRSIGVATVRDQETGRILATNLSMPVVTVVAQRLDMALEYRDVNGDGIFAYRPIRTTPDDPFDIDPMEPLVKIASLSGDWNLSGFALTAVSDDEVDAAFTMSLDGAAYRFAEPAGHNGDGFLNRVAFTVHVKLTRETFEVHDMPHFDATLARTGGRHELVGLEPAGTINGTFTSISARFKIDHDIVGWDFAAPRVDVESRLLLHTIVVVGSAIDARMANWLSDRALDGANAAEARAPTESNGTVNINESRTPADFVRIRSIDLSDSWRRIGGLGWTPGVDVYANASSTEARQGEVHFQVLGGGAIAGRDGGAVYRGFVLSGGYSYPAGYRLYHDPVLEASGVEVEPSFLTGLWNALVIVAQVAVAVVVVLGLLGLAAAGSSRSAKSRARIEAKRLGDLQQRYKLPDPGGDWKEVR